MCINVLYFATVTIFHQFLVATLSALVRIYGFVGCGFSSHRCPVRSTGRQQRLSGCGTVCGSQNLNGLRGHREAEGERQSGCGADGRSMDLYLWEFYHRTRGRKLHTKDISCLIDDKELGHLGHSAKWYYTIYTHPTMPFLPPSRRDSAGKSEPRTELLFFIGETRNLSESI